MDMPTVYLMLGLPGSGKTTFSKDLEKRLSIPRLSLDEEYEKLGGDLTSSKWNMDIEAKAHELIKSQMEEIVSRRQSVILDFCPWKKDARYDYRQYIQSIGALSHLYYLDVPTNELKRRLVERNNTPDGSAHIVTAGMLDAFIAKFDPPVDEEYELMKTLR